MIQNFSLNTTVSNVVGLPVAECASALLQHGVIDVRNANAHRSKP